MTDNANVFLTFTGGPYTTHLTFDNPYVGNYIGTLGGFPSLVGNSTVQLVGTIAAQLVGGAGQIKAIDAGVNIANTGSNTTIKVPSAAQVSNTIYYLNANGSWGVPPGTYSPPTGFSGAVSTALANTITIVNGVITAVT